MYERTDYPFGRELTPKEERIAQERFTMIAGTDNITAIVRFRKVYEVTRGAGQTHIRGVDGAAEFEIDADYYELFEGVGVVYVDGIELGAENYDAWSGSTVISLKASYLDTLAVGEHTLAVEFDDGGMARATFIIADPAVPEESGDTPASADTGVFTSAAGGAVAASVSVIAVAMIAGGAYLVVKKSRK